MRVIHIIPYIGEARGGPVISMADYLSALKDSECQLTVAAAPRSNDGNPVKLPAGVEQHNATKSYFGMFRFSPGFVRRLSKNEGYDVVHSHGLWTYASIAADRVSRRQNIPHVITPCGMLQEGALKRSRFKKNVCKKMFQVRILEHAVCIHAKSETEYKQIRSFGTCNPIAMIPNMILQPDANIKKADIDNWKRHHGVEGKRLVLYVGRIHPVKGLERLLNAWTDIMNGEKKGWHLIIAGPDENGYKAELVKSIRHSGSMESIDFIGALEKKQKWISMEAADLFVMPSDFENFGTAIAEAMMAGCPVITTTATPWSEVVEKAAGWYVTPDSNALRGALREAMHLSDNERAEMGEHAKVIAARFRSEIVGKQLLSLYRWVMRRTQKPNFVRLH